MEWKSVFLIGSEQGIFPHSRTINEYSDGVEQERRLFYVSISRSSCILIITYCKNRQTNSYGGRPNFYKAEPSQFLYEAGLLESPLPKGRGFLLQ